jgi:hypothetical protein
LSRESESSERIGPQSEITLYQTEDGLTRVQLRLHEGTVWLTQKQLAELYQVTVPAISQHLDKIFEDRELAPEATIKHFLTVRTEGNRSISRTVDHYSLPVVIAIGYRVRSVRGTQFRRWATTHLEECLVQADWIAKLDGFLQFNEHNILMHVGTVSQALAAAHAEAEFERYDAEQRRLEVATAFSDFDRLVETTGKLAPAKPTKPATPKKP